MVKAKNYIHWLKHLLAFRGKPPIGSNIKMPISTSAPVTDLVDSIENKNNSKLKGHSSDPRISGIDAIETKNTWSCTIDFAHFHAEYFANISYFADSTQVIQNADDMRVKFAALIMKEVDDPEITDNLAKATQNPNALMDSFKKYEAVVKQNLVTSIVNAFHRFLYSIIASAILKQPKILASNQTVKLEEVLRFTRHKDLVAHLVEKKIHELSYASLADLVDYLKDKFGIVLFKDAREMELVKLVFEARNIITHNGGVVNDMFLKRVGRISGFHFEKGKKLIFSAQDLTSVMICLFDVAVRMDKNVSKKFRLRVKPIVAWPL